ncbi:MAG: hypothetical protein WCB68_07505 [Pyrinomonadaceae bacterium]
MESSSTSIDEIAERITGRRKATPAREARLSLLARLFRAMLRTEGRSIMVAVSLLTAFLLCYYQPARNYSISLAPCKENKRLMKKKEKPGMNSVDDLISISEAARIRGVTHGAIQDLLARGKLTPVVVAGRRLLRRGEVKAYKPERAGRPKTRQSGK